MGGIKMKQFNLQEYLANPNRQVVTREGQKARIVCTDRAGLNAKPIVALITLHNGDEVIKTFWDNGIETAGSEDKNDLFFAPEKHEGWINVYRNPYTGETSFGVTLYNSQKEAEDVGKSDDYYVATGKFEWEE